MKQPLSLIPTWKMPTYWQQDNKLFRFDRREACSQETRAEKKARMDLEKDELVRRKLNQFLHLCLGGRSMILPRSMVVVNLRVVEYWLGWLGPSGSFLKSSCSCLRS